jgi:hypothetical protein
MTGSENTAHLEVQPKSAWKKLVYGAMLKVCLPTMEGERKQIHIQLFKVNKVKQNLIVYIKFLHSELAYF